MSETCERLTVGAFPSNVEQEHIERYKFIQKYVVGKNVLDIACGTGYGSRMLLDAGAKSVKGVDLSQVAIDHANKEYSCKFLEFSTGDAENLISIKNNTFDMVISFETIEHLLSVDKYLAEISRVLKPGGVFFVSTPDRRLSSVLYPFTRTPSHPFHIKEFTFKEFVSILQKNFNVEACMGQAFVNRLLVFFPVQIIFKTLKRLIPLTFVKLLVENLYHIGSGLSVQDCSRCKLSIARFWVMKCRKPL